VTYVARLHFGPTSEVLPTCTSHEREKKMAMNIRKCSEECGNLTVQDGPCEECQDVEYMPAARQYGIQRARAFRAGVEVNDYDYAGAN
jgi:hypothetical protein